MQGVTIIKKPGFECNQLGEFENPSTSVGEMRNGKRCGKTTEYETGRINNTVIEEGSNMYICLGITDHPEHAFYLIDGTPNKAVVANWRDYYNEL